MYSIETSNLISSLVDPCSFDTNSRTQVFILSDPSAVNAGDELRFTLPGNEVCDLSESYFTFQIQLLNTVPEVPYIGSLVITGVAASGHFRLMYHGYTTDQLAWNAPAITIQNAIQALPTFGGVGYVATVGGTTVNANDITITISGFSFSVLPDQLAVVDNCVQTAGNVLCPLCLNETQAAVFPFPRLETYVPLIRQIKVEFDAVQIAMITSANLLNSASELLRSVDSRYGLFQTNVADESGVFWDNVFRVSLDLQFLDVLRKVYPMKYFPGKLFKIYLQTETPNFCLSQSAANQSYSIISAQLNYHRLELNEQLGKRISELYNSTGVVIGYNNWQTFLRNVPAGPISDDFTFNPNTQNFLGSMFVFSPNTYRNTPINFRKMSLFLKESIGSYRLKIGTKYFPSDEVDSLASFRDNTEMVETLLNFTDLWLNTDAHNRDDKIAFLNYSGKSNIGNDPNDLIYIPEFDISTRMSCLMAIACADYPSSKLDCHLLKSKTGQDTRTLTNVTLEIKNMTLLQPATLYIYSLSQAHCVVKSSGIVYYK